MQEYNSDWYSDKTFNDIPRWDDFSPDDEKVARKRFSRFAMALSIYMLIPSVLMVALELALPMFFPSNYTQILENPMFIWGANVVLMYVISLPILYLTVFRMKKTIRVKSRIGMMEFIKLICISSSLMYIGSTIASVLSSVITAITGITVPDHTADLIESSPIWLIILVAVIIGPIVEELIFRKLLMDRLGIYGDRTAIVFSAVIFGLFHGNFYQLFYATLLGFLLAYVYARTSKLVYPIAIHMIVNFCGSVIPILLMDSFERFYELYDEFTATTEFSSEFLRLYVMVGLYSFVTLSLLIAGIVIFIKNRRRIFVSDRCEVLIPKEKRCSVIIGNAGVVIFTVLMVASMILSVLM